MAEVKAKKAVETENGIPAGFRYITAPNGRESDQPLIIGVNGKNTAIPQDGKQHLVPEAVAYEYERSLEAERQFFRTMDRLHNQSQVI